MRALILAAGRGERLRPHTDLRPKCLVPFAGRPLIEWQLAALRAAGIDEIGIVSGYRGTALERYGLQRWENPDWERTNMVASLFCARDWLVGAEPVVVAYGDLVYEPRLITALIAAAGDIAVAVDTGWLALWQERFSDILADAESLRMSDDGRLLDVGRRVDAVEEVQAQYMGLLRFSVTGLGQLTAFGDRAAAGDASLGGLPLARAAMTDLLRGMIQAGIDLRAVPLAHGWLEIDTVDDLALYEGWRGSGRLDRFFRGGELAAW